MKKGNFIAAILCFLLGVFVLIEAILLPDGAEGVPGPGMFPVIIAVILILSACALFISTLRMKPEDNTKIEPFSKDAKRVYLSMAALIVYILVLPYVGFCTTTAVMLFFFLNWFSKKGIVPCVLISVLITAVIYLIFNRLLNVPLNFGLLL